MTELTTVDYCLLVGGWAVVFYGLGCLVWALVLDYRERQVRRTMERLQWREFKDQ